MENNYKDCMIISGKVNKAVIVNKNTYSESVNLDELSELLDKLIVESNSETERKYAITAKNYANKQNRTELVNLIKANFSTFTSGTFATLAGGFLLEMIKKLMTS